MIREKRVGRKLVVVVVQKNNFKNIYKCLQPDLLIGKNMKIGFGRIFSILEINQIEYGTLGNRTFDMRCPERIKMKRKSRIILAFILEPINIHYCCLKPESFPSSKCSKYIFKHF